MLVSHLNKTLKLSNLIHIFLIISFISIRNAFININGASIITICFSAIGVVFIYLRMVKIFVSSYNPQITKARVNNLHKSNITLNSGFCMRVGISEAIRMLFFTPKRASLKYLFTLVNPLGLHQGHRLKKKQTSNNKALILFFSTFNFLFKIVSVLNSTNTNTATVPTEKGDSNSVIENLKPLITTTLNLKSNTLKPEEKRFNQWLAGLIDGDGCFQLSTKGYASLEIVAHIRDKNCLYQIKQKFGGAIKLRTNLNHLRFRMHHKQGMLDIIKAVNGEIRNPIRLLQLNKICEKYNIPVLQPAPLTYKNA
jgi:LAGLIDADG DNA endonuclease family protein